jgi:hypothetical protein
VGLKGSFNHQDSRTPGDASDAGQGGEVLPRSRQGREEEREIRHGAGSMEAAGNGICKTSEKAESCERIGEASNEGAYSGSELPELLDVSPTFRNPTDENEWADVREIRILTSQNFEFGRSLSAYLCLPFGRESRDQVRGRSIPETPRTRPLPISGILIAFGRKPLRPGKSLGVGR